MATVTTSDNVQVTLTSTFISNCPAIKDMISDLGNQDDFPIQIDSETIQAFSVVFDKLVTCDGSDQSVADMNKWLSDWADFKTPAGHFDILKYQKYILASSHLTGGGENSPYEEKPKTNCGAKKLTKIFGKKMCDLVAFKTPEQIREAVNICSSCYRVPCLAPEIRMVTHKVPNMKLKVMETKQIEERIPCEDCDACKAVYCQHNKILNHLSKEEEEKPIPRYEEWKAKMGIIEAANSTQPVETC